MLSTHLRASNSEYHAKNWKYTRNIISTAVIMFKLCIIISNFIFHLHSTFWKSQTATVIGQRSETFCLICLYLSPSLPVVVEKIPLSYRLTLAPLVYCLHFIRVKWERQMGRIKWKQYRMRISYHISYSHSISNSNWNCWSHPNRNNVVNV